MGSTMSMFLGLEAFVDAVVRGQKVGNRATVEESMLDIVAPDAREIVYGLAFSKWAGARLHSFLALAGRRYHPLFLRVMDRRIRTLSESHKLADEFDLDALSDLLVEFRGNHPELGAQVDGLAALCHHEHVDGDSALTLQ